MKKQKTRILFFDIETMANLAWVWGKYEQNVIDYEMEWYMLCFAWKWLGESQTHVLGLPDFSGYKKDPENDRKLVLELWKLFNEADIIIAHNGDEFDIKKANARFIYHGLTPPAGYRTVDTKKVAKRYFKFNSNKLDDLGNLLGLGRKIDTGGFELWKGCALGDMPSWNKMMKYNKQDIVLLEKVYFKLLPWMTAHPNLNLTEGTLCNCPNCSSHKIQSRGTMPVGRTSIRRRYQCQDCGSWFSGALVKKEGLVLR